MKTPTAILKEEHQLILRMLSVAEKVSNRFEEDSDIDMEVFLQIGDFIQNFADRCHHAKEEDILFKRMKEKGIPEEGGPIGVMLYEHGQGRNFTKRMVEAAQQFKSGKTEAKQEILINLRQYIQLLRNHIYKEDNILYPMGDRVFDQKDQSAILEEFDNVEQNVIGSGVHEKYHRLVENLEQTYESGKR